MSNALPKLSYVLLAHNREQYIRAAIESAFAQDYKGELEYIFSDDCSTDSSYAIMQECVANYNGKRKITLTQTPSNLNLAGHTNHAVALATGDYVVRADDDDYSFPNRCSLLAEAIAIHPEALCFIEPYTTVSDLPNIEEFIASPQSEERSYFCYEIEQLAKAGRIEPLWRHGVKSYAIVLYRDWPPLPLDAANVDDVCMSLRALSQGCICLISGSPSILYLRGLSNMSGSSEGDGSVAAMYQKEKKLVSFHARAAKGITACCEQLKQKEAENSKLISMVDSLIKHHIIQRDWWGKSTFQRITHNKKALLAAPIKARIYILARCLPLPLATRVCSIICRIKRPHIDTKK